MKGVYVEFEFDAGIEFDFVIPAVAVDALDECRGLVLLHEAGNLLGNQVFGKSFVGTFDFLPFTLAVELHLGAVGVEHFVFVAEEAYFFDGVGKCEAGEIGLQELLGWGWEFVDGDGAFIVVGFGNGQCAHGKQGCEKQFFHGFKNF